MSMVSYLLVLLAIVSANCNGKIYGENDYIEFYTGNMNLLISVPHDGFLLPQDISNRVHEKVEYLRRDTYTLEIAKIIRNKFIEHFYDQDLVPFMVQNNLHRIKMDPNVKVKYCCQDSHEASQQAYNDYHEFIAKNFNRNFIRKNNIKKGLLLDFHGHTDPEEWIELGYLLTANDLSNAILSDQEKKSSICQLATTSKYDFERLIRGDVSLGNFIESRVRRLKAIPSQTNFRPYNAEDYHNGGYIIRKHGSQQCHQKYSNINAIQIDLPSSIRRKGNYSQYAEALANALIDFYKLHFL